jgi:UDP-N-acetylmuramoyl-tripeptide--D-alanyl-D-alanine ligase
LIKLVLDEICTALRADAVPPVRPVSVGGVSTDSRTTSPGDLFFALRGENFDGHEYVQAAFERGAVAAVVAAAQLDDVRRRVAHFLGQGACLLSVTDPLHAYGRLANYHRRQVPAEVIAVVGSNGKTTAKTMISHVLGGRLKGRGSPKSFNNAVGVPHTLLSVGAADDFVAVEIGTNAPGEVAHLAQIAEPDLAVITSIAEEHLEGLRDLAGVAREECSILQFIRPGGFVAVNADAPLVRDYLPVPGITCVTFGRGDDCDLRLSDITHDADGVRFRVNGRFEYRVPLPGVHNALNAAAAIAIGRRLGCEHDEMAARFESFTPPPMRHQLLSFGGVRILNDAYNSNPGSAVAAIETLESLPCTGRRFCVFGEMRELGAQAAAMHQTVAQRLRRSNGTRVVLVGAAADYMADTLAEPGLFTVRSSNVPDPAAAARLLSEELQPGDLVLLKASRAVGLEQVIEPLRAALERTSAARDRARSAG